MIAVAIFAFVLVTAAASILVIRELRAARRQEDHRATIENIGVIIGAAILGLMIAVVIATPPVAQSCAWEMQRVQGNCAARR